MKLTILRKIFPITLLTFLFFGFAFFTLQTNDIKIDDINIDLDVDTDRDGFVDEVKDELGEDSYKKNLGALYSVNFDGDGNLMYDYDFGNLLNEDPGPVSIPDGLHVGVVPDRKEIFLLDNEMIENNADELDITPLVIRKLNKLPAEAKVYLKVEELEDIQSILVYKEIAAGENAIWGGFGDRIDGEPPEPIELEVTNYVSMTRDAIFGIEGFLFKNSRAVDFPFDGEVDIKLEIRINSKVLGSDKVKLKVAPWIMLSHLEQSKEAWVINGNDNEKFRLTAKADPGYYGLDHSGQLEMTDFPYSGNQWIQDHVEIGYYKRPGGPATICVFRLPYKYRVDNLYSNQLWPLKELLQNDVAAFQIYSDLNGGSGDYGGNIELLPPNSAFPLGRIVVGDIRSQELMDFMIEQEMQPPIEIPTGWLSVGHVDEVICFLNESNKVVISDPKLAVDLLNKIPVSERGSSVFFATGSRPYSGSVSNNSINDTRLDTEVDHRGQNWKYVRIYSGVSKGQVAEISKLENDYIEIGKVWNTTSNVIPFITGGLIEDQNHYYFMMDPAPNKNGWFVRPQDGDKYVLLEGTKFWASNTPAVITVDEIIKDTEFQNFNLIDVQKQIKEIQDILVAEAGVSLNFIKVPTLYFGMRANFRDRRFSVAFNPGLANLQIIGGNYYFPKQFGPLNNNGEDIFEKEIKSKFKHAYFVDDWEIYHRLDGEVHCGSYSLRDIPKIDWWKIP